MLTVQLILPSGKFSQPTVYELKTELQSLFNIQPGTLEISASDVTLADSDLIAKVAALGGNKRVRPIMSCYDGNNFVGQIMVEPVLVGGQSSSDSSFETVSSDGSQLSLSELSSGSSNLKRGHKRNAQGHETFKKVLESSEECVQIPSYGGMEEACGMGGCETKSRPCSVKSEMEIEPDDINGQQTPYINILQENWQFVQFVTGVTAIKSKQRTFPKSKNIPKNSSNRSQKFFAHSEEETTTTTNCLISGSMFIVTWPKVEPCLHRIFKFLELQNSDITTEKWAVVSRENAAPIVTDICPNEQVEIWMDANSVDIIKERCNHLKLSFWKIEFEFCD
ncbi:uncharacterized protein LOC111519388 [Drosophila willistoni]|uniref:uncharacterized protein LOC111519388 n=1 Tax=Drosophila willistoni TaxID=7260 RepID=UPI000C26C3A1|nr:uncharacterized protein LOC111519388 [Drosophila willistoni]